MAEDIENAIEKANDAIAGMIKDVHARAGGSPCVFRGENKDYGKISCTLYRAQKKIIEETIKEGEQEAILKELDFPAIEREIIKKAQSHFSASTTKFEILTDLQHYGGKTTLIDCTRNILIALFFACNGEPEEDGRVICLDTKKINTAQDLYGENYKNDETLLLSPQSKRNRPTFQSSVFVHAPKGVLEVNEEVMIIEIKGKKEGQEGQKQKYLDALQRYHGIDATTVFNDLQGFITNEDTHKAVQKYFYIALSYDNKGEYDKAIEYYDKAIELDPDHARTYNNRGNAKAELQQYPEAIADYDTAIRLEPNYADAYYNRGAANKKLENYDKAIADYDKAIALKPDHADAYYNRGLVQYALGKHKESIADYDTAIRLQPDYARAYYNRGLVQYALGKHKESIADYDIVIELNQDNDAEAYNNRGNAKAELQQYDEAIADYDTAIRLQPDDATAYSNRGLAKANLEQYKEAILDYDKAIALNPDYAKAYYNRGVAKVALGEYDEAIADYDTAIRLEPNYADAYYNRGAANKKLENYDKAIADYDKAIALKPDHADACYNRGLAYTALGDQAQGDDIAAAEYYTKALQDYTKALQDYEKALALEPSYKNEAEQAIQALQDKLQQLRAKDTKQ